jgi:4-hydroxy 2-oxovalerate aldolase
MRKTHIIISDPSLRDGNHAVAHQLSQKRIAEYCKLADQAKIPIVEVGHGNGLGASSMQLGEAPISDKVTLETARENLKHSKLGIHVIPGFATIEKDIKSAIDYGVDVFRIASHCSEADVTRRHIEFLRKKDKEVYGVLMMSHMISIERLVEEARKMESYGAQGLVFMDSSGHYLPINVKQRVEALVKELSIPVGFHGHNNLGMGIANSLAAVQSGALLLDGTICGFGPGAGNAQLEVLVAVLKMEGYDTGIDLYKLLDAATWAEKELVEEIPVIRPISIVSGMAGVFSAFLKPVKRIAEQYDVDPRDVFFELGRRKLIAGQEDLILEVVIELANAKHKEIKPRSI